jgi:hypothetical protein
MRKIEKVLSLILDRLERLEAGFVDAVAAIRLQQKELDRLRGLVDVQGRMLVALGGPEESCEKEPKERIN